MERAPSATTRKAKGFVAVAAALTGCFLASYHTKFIGAGLLDLKGAFGLSVDEASWLSTVANAPQILSAPAVPFLAMALGIRAILFWPGLLYALLVALIPFARDPLVLYALHAVTAVLLGLFVPATMLVIVRNLPPSLWLPGFAAYAFRLGFTSNTGHALTGYMVQHVGWQWLYWADVPLALLMAALAWMGSAGESSDRTLLVRADWGGMALFGGGLSLIYVGLDQGNRLDWQSSGMVVLTIASGGALMLCFFIHEALIQNPWASPSVLRQWNTAFGILAAVAFSLCAVSNAVLIPSFLSTVAGLRPEQFGPFLAICFALPLVLIAALSALLLQRTDFRLILALGFFSFAASAIHGTRLTSQWRLDDFLPIALLQSVGLGLTFTAVMVGNFSAIRPERAASFAAYIQILRLVAVEFGTALFATFLRVREQIHSNLTGLHLGRGDPDVMRFVAERSALYQHVDLDHSKAIAISSLAAAVQREANALAYIDGFWLTFVCAIIGLISSALMKPAPPGPLTTRP